VAGGNPVIAVQTSSNGLRYYWNDHGTSNWHGQQVAASGTTFSQPSIAADGNALVITAEGPGNTLDFYWQASGSSTWNPEVVAGARTTYSAPVIAQNGNGVIISAEGYANSLDFYWAANGNSTWNPEVVAGAGTTTAAPAMIANAYVGGVNIVALENYNSVMYFAYNGSPTWTSSAVSGYNNFTPSIVAYPGSQPGVHIVSDILFASLVMDSAANAIGNWQESDACVGSFRSGGCAGSAPAVTMNGGLVNVAVKGAGTDDLDFWQQDSSGNWHEEVVDAAANL